MFKDNNIRTTFKTFFKDLIGFSVSGYAKPFPYLYVIVKSKSCLENLFSKQLHNSHKLLDSTLLGTIFKFLITECSRYKGYL